MRLAFLGSFAIAIAVAQQTSPTGFGRQIYPSGIAPTSAQTGGAGFGRIIYPGTGAPAALRPGVSPVYGFTPPAATHDAHTRSAVVPFPIFYGGGYYAAFEPPPAPTRNSDVDYYDLTQRAPIVIINQAYRPETIDPESREPSTLAPLAPRQTAPQAAQRDPHADDPTIIRIALTDGTVFEAVGYWVEGNTLHYVTLEGSRNLATLDLVDRELSKKLNDENNVEFKLPKR